MTRKNWDWSLVQGFQKEGECHCIIRGVPDFLCPDCKGTGKIPRKEKRNERD